MCIASVDRTILVGKPLPGHSFIPRLLMETRWVRQDIIATIRQASGIGPASSALSSNIEYLIRKHILLLGCPSCGAPKHSLAVVQSLGLQWQRPLLIHYELQLMSRGAQGFPLTPPMGHFAPLLLTSIVYLLPCCIVPFLLPTMILKKSIDLWLFPVA